MSKKRKGMSIDDKQKTVLSLYHDKLEPFNLKEIENLASKAGVVQQTVKDVNQMLVDDFLVYQDKIGAANIFWSFPSKTFKDRQLLAQKLQNDLASCSKSCDTLVASIEEARVNRSSSDRVNNLAKYKQLCEERDELNKKLEIHKANDPAEVKRIVDSAATCKTAAHRWVDNIFAVKAYLVKTKGLPSKEVDRLLQIDADFDYDEMPVGGGGGGKKSKKLSTD